MAAKTSSSGRHPGQLIEADHPCLIDQILGQEALRMVDRELHPVVTTGIPSLYYAQGPLILGARTATSKRAAPLRTSIDTLTTCDHSSIFLIVAPTTSPYPSRVTAIERNRLGQRSDL